MRAKILVTFTVLFSLLSVGWAQKPSFTPESFLGITGGATVSMVNFLPSVNQDYLMGYSGGIVFRHNSQAHLGMQAELNYSQRGWKELNGYSRQLEYIEFPFMSHFYVGKKVQFYLNLGPKVSVLIHQSVQSNASGNASAEQYKPIDNPIDYGFCGGFGLQVHAGRQVFLIDTRVNYSISTLFSDRLTDHFRNSNNMNAALTAAWLIKTN